MAKDPGVEVRVDGLRDLRRDLDRVAPEVDQRLEGDFEQIGDQVAAEARAGAVRLTGGYAASIQPYAVPGGVSIESRLPQAGILHWGGVIQPRGVPITFPARPVISEAMERQADRIVDMVGDSIDDAARDAGWRR